MSGGSSGNAPLGSDWFGPSSTSSAPAAPAAPAKSSGALGSDWFNSPGSDAGVQQAGVGGDFFNPPSGKSSGGGGVFGFAQRALKGAEGAITGLPGGLAALGKDLGVTSLHAGENIVNDVAGSHLGPSTGWRDHGGVVASQQEITNTLNDRPALRAAVQGLKQSGNEVVHPSQILTNYGRNPVGAALNDAANASLILGPLSGAADAAAQGAAEGSAAGTAASGIAKAADVAHTVATAPTKPFTFAAEKIAGLAPIADRLDQMKANSQARSAIAEGLTQPTRQAVGEAAAAHMPLFNLNPDEQAASILGPTGRNEFALTANAISRLTPAEQDVLFQRIAESRNEPGITPEALKAAYESTLQLPTEGVQRIEQASQPVTDLRNARQEAALAGEGMAGGKALNPTQAGFEPLNPEGNPLDVKNWPARLRPMGIAANDTIKQLQDMGHGDIAAEITPTLEAIRNAGEDAQHVIGGSDTRPGGTGRAPTGVPREKPTGAQIQRLGNRTEYTAAGQAGLELRRAVEGVRNQFAQRIADPANGYTSTADTLDPEGTMTGKDLATSAQMQGMVPWDPAKGQPFFPKGPGNVAPGDVTRDTLFMPSRLYDAFSKQEPSIPDPGSPGGIFDRINRVARKNPLLLSPAYHLRIATSNAMMAGLAGDLTANPIELAKRIGEAKQMLSDGTAPRALIRNGLFGDEQALMDARRAANGGEGVAAKAMHAPVQMGQKLSATIDNFSRVMSYIGEKSKGYSDEEAVRRANEAIGNYDQLNPFEQNVMKRILPIYPWLKQVATVAGRLAKDHPVASLFALHAGDLFSQSQPGGLPSYLKGSIPFGNGKFIPTNLVNPFEVFTATPGGFVSPLIKAPVAALTGLNLNNWTQYTRPPGQPTSGALWHNPGELKYVLAGMNPISKFLRDQSEGAPIQRYQTGEPKLDKGGQLQPAAKPGGTLAPLLAAAGLPAPQAVDLAKNQAAATKRETTQAKAGAKYQAKLKNATQGKQRPSAKSVFGKAGK